MSRLKQKIPDTEALKQRFDAVLLTSYGDFISSTHVRREAVLGSRRYALVAGAFAVAVLFSLYFIDAGKSEVVRNIFIVCAILWLLVVLVSARRWFTDSQLLTKEINMALMPVISSTLDRTVMYTYNIFHRDETIALLKDSLLMTVEDIEVTADDMLTAFGEAELSMRELIVTTKSQSSRSSKGENIELFKGVFIVATLPFMHPAETYISTDSDRVGFAHRTFWSDILGRNLIKETILEWNDFEDKLHVATIDPVAAREILTPEFMHDLYTWWLEHKLNMRIAIKANKFYMLLPESSIKVGFSTSSTKPENIRDYAFSLIRPLWRSLVLLEDVIGRKDML